MGEKIRMFREKAGMTQKELADALKLNQTSVSRWETGEHNPTASKIVQIAQVLNCLPGDLF